MYHWSEEDFFVDSPGEFSGPLTFVSDDTFAMLHCNVTFKKSAPAFFSELHNSTIDRFRKVNVRPWK